MWTCQLLLSALILDTIGPFNLKTRSALLEFSYNLAINNMDEAFRAVKVTIYPRMDTSGRRDCRSDSTPLTVESMFHCVKGHQEYFSVGKYGAPVHQEQEA